MKLQNKTYWKGLEQLKNDSEFVKNNEKEFSEELPIKDAYGDNTDSAKEEGTSRRDFLKAMGFGVAAVSLAACETPIKHAVPLLNKPENYEPSIANFYASTYTDGSDYCSVLVKTREGRPIFIEGNAMSPITKGGVNSRVSASVLSLYDSEKAQNPTKVGAKTDWNSLDTDIKQQLGEVASSGAGIYIVSQTVLSPSTKRVIADFTAKYPTTQHIAYDTLSQYGLAEAHNKMFGKFAVPRYDFSKAKSIVGIDADFLGSWISDVEHSKQYAQTRRISKDKKEMSRHFHFETAFTISGASADYRNPIKPSQLGIVVGLLRDKVAAAKGASASGFPSIKDLDKALERAAKHLVENAGSGLVVCGSNDVNVQILVADINNMLGNYGNTLDMARPSFQKQGNDAKMNQFIEDLKGGKAGAVLFYGCNPAYDHPRGAEIASSIKAAKISVSSAERLDETASLCTYNCPDRHFLESWNDAEPQKGSFSLCQPAIRPVFNTRQFQDSLLKWSDNPKDYLAYLQEFWTGTVAGMQSAQKDGSVFWKTSLHDGVFHAENISGYKSIHEGGAPKISPLAVASVAAAATETTTSDAAASTVAPTANTASGAGEAAEKVKSAYKADSKGVELIVFASPVMGNGSQANNPWIQETPEPISKICWGHFVAVPQAWAKEKGLKMVEGKTVMASVKANGKTAQLPVAIIPGLAADTIAITVGYGRDAKAGKVAFQAGGFNALSMTTIQEGAVSMSITQGVSIELLTDAFQMAQTQTHGTFMGRQTVIQEALLADYVNGEALKKKKYIPKISTYSGKELPTDLSLWDINADMYGKDHHALPEVPTEEEKKLWKHKYAPKRGDQHMYPLHHWGMVIDLNTCTGCSACIVACHLENNVPVVGREEVARRREMHWMRIDRYFSSSGTIGDDASLEIAAENPEVVFQPMMCQHCNNAPCETVCPVVATTHSTEGLNQMTYNRCVGTKYCANNCPYKVRRFNWFNYTNNEVFDYHLNNPLGKMVLNPDVTVRSRGVMEKCSLCVQRIQEVKLRSRREKRKVMDGEAMVACASSCPVDAITFGDLNNPDSKVRQLLESELELRAYNVLHEIGVSPNVWYLTKVRNKEQEKA